MSILENNILKPFINHIPSDNFVFSVLEEDSNVFNHFIMNHYIEFCAQEILEEQKYLYRYTDSCLWNKFTEFSHIFIPRENIHQVKQSHIMDILDAGYIILTCVNTNFIDAYQANLDIQNLSHEIMIYGYDDRNEIFLCKDFFEFAYEEKPAGFKEIVKGMENYCFTNYVKNDTGLVAIKVWDKFPEDEINFDKAQYLNHLNNSMNKRMDTFRKTEQYLIDHPEDYQISSFRVFFNYIYENLRMDEKRIKILQNNNMIATSDYNHIMEHNDIIRKSLMCSRNFCIKKELKEYMGKDGKSDIDNKKLMEDIVTSKNNFEEAMNLILHL